MYLKSQLAGIARTDMGELL